MESQQPPAQEKPLKACCACPETRKARDNCILLNGEEKCLSFIQAHNECLRSKGFQVPDVKKH